MPHKGNGHGEHNTALEVCPRCGHKVKKFKLKHHKSVCKGKKTMTKTKTK